MAATKAGAALTETHRLQQLALRASVVRDVAKLWPMWTPSNPGSYQAFETAMALLVQSRSRQSWALAARYYEMFSGLEAPAAAVKSAIQMAALVDAKQIAASISATSRAAVYSALAAGQPYEQAMASGLVQVSGSASRLVLNTGRDTIIEAVTRDRRALGWARVTDSAPCAFCAMLAGRGPVYSEATADFQSHGHCGCTAEPVFSRTAEWPGQGRKYEALWTQTGSLNTFRQALIQKAAAAATAVANT